MTGSPNRHYSGHHRATEEDGDQGILGEEIRRKKCGQQDTSTAGGRWRWQHKTELDGDKWSVACVPLGATRHMSRPHIFAEQDLIGFKSDPAAYET